MVTKFHIYLSILLPLLLNACGILTVHGSGNIAIETRDVHDFDHVVFSGTGELLLTQGDEETLAVEADDNLMEYVESEVRNGILYIGEKGTISPSQPIRFKLQVREIVGLDVAGIASAETEAISTERLEIVVSGMSTLRIGALEAQELTIHLNGPTEVELTETGDVTEQEIVISGPGSYHAPGLHSQSVNLTINGPGNATVWATDFLSISVSGIGNVDYYGSPQITQTGSGNVSVNSLGNP